HGEHGKHGKTRNFPSMFSVPSVPSVIQLTSQKEATPMKKAKQIQILILVLSLSFTAIPSALAKLDPTTYKLPDGAVARLGKGYIGRGHTVAFSPDGRMLAVATSIGIWLYDARTYDEIDLLTGHTDPVSSVAFSPDGSLLASGSWDQTVKLWSVAERREIATLQGHNTVVSSVAFSPDGSLLASGSWDKTVKLWSVAERREIATLKGHSIDVLSVAFSPDGSLLASGSWDQTVKLWSVAERREIATLQGHRDGVSSVAFSPDGSLLASGSGDGTVLLWKVDLTSPFAVEAKGKRFITLGELKRTMLLQNFPNPFNPETWIPYQLSEAGEVTITIYDTAGRLVRRIPLGYQAAGVYYSKAKAAYWDGRNSAGEPVGSGVYFYHLQTAHFSASRKLVLVK
ncbi:T9SS type A sorting domain-containing protein, partial [Candidatus Poribacteria bacterium]|nr:T9SS type A sorting domain-containing protein [Candidatus Poribacteria bacterium]